MSLSAPETTEDPLNRLLLFGVNARTVAAPLRDALFAEDPDQASLIAAVKNLNCEEALVLATCERLEFLVVPRPGQRVAGALLQLIAAAAGCAPADLAGQSYSHMGPDALRHLLGVAASLDSQVLGEPQILGQVKQCYRAAQEAGTAGPLLAAAAQAAFAAAKRVRRETPVGQQASSMTLAATQVARDLFGRFDGLNLLWVGLGEMGEMLSDDFAAAGVTQRLLMHPSPHRAEAMARRLGCNFAPWEELEQHLAEADIVISDAGTGRFTLGHAQVAAALKRRRHRPVLLIDAGVPADIEPGTGDLEDAFVYDLDDLERLASRQSGGRAAASAMAWGIVEDELAAFLRAQAERPAIPSVVALRHHFDAVRQQVLESGETDAEAATRLLVNKLLHDPSEALRRAVAEDPALAVQLEDMIRRLFDLPQGGAGADKD
ncbi:glutamyl-tRNA reductase [Pelagibius marinus]|uniref:glutamyl-tRNA reductase n=1 Tax=Pelagibius marinus TaxID=2762760 RepID=UPI001872A8A4|nr:glutamyl-tRNA reductase [Pelagibius marinus]